MNSSDAIHLLGLMVLVSTNLIQIFEQANYVKTMKRERRKIYHYLVDNAQQMAGLLNDD